MWTVGICIGLLTASGIVAVVRAIPASYASIPNERAAPNELEDTYVDDPAVHFAVAQDTISRRGRAWCPECGFVESIRHMERSGNVAVAAGASGEAFGRAIAASPVTGRDYEITVRLRGGSTTVFNEATPLAWRLGSRVIVIGGSNAARD